MLNSYLENREGHVISPTTYTSFLVRMWREHSPELPESAADWQREVEHIQTGQRWTFSTLVELLDFLRQWVEGQRLGVTRQASERFSIRHCACVTLKFLADELVFYIMVSL